MAAPLTTGEAAAVSVARAQQAPERRRHGAPLPARAHRQTVALDLRHDLGVAAEPPRGLGSYDRTVFQLGAAACISGERGSVDMNDQLRALGPLVPLVLRPVERRPGKLDQRLHAKRPGRIERRRHLRSRRLGLGRSGLPLLPAPLHDPLSRGVQRLHEQRPVLGGEPGAQVERAVLLEVVAHELELVRLARVLRRDPPEDPQRTLELRGRQRSRELEQPLLVRRSRPASAREPSCMSSRRARTPPGSPAGPAAPPQPACTPALRAR